MMHLSRLAPWVGLAVLVLLLWGGLQLAKKVMLEPIPTKVERREKKVPPSPSQLGDIEVRGGKIRGKDASGKAFDVTYKTLRHEAKEGQLRLQDVTCRAYLNGELASVFTAPELVVLPQEGKLLFSGGVMFWSQLHKVKGRVQLLTWQWRQGKVYGRDGVRMERVGIRLQGEKLEADTSLGEWTLTGSAQLWMAVRGHLF